MPIPTIMEEEGIFGRRVGPGEVVVEAIVDASGCQEMEQVEAVIELVRKWEEREANGIA